MKTLSTACAITAVIAIGYWALISGKARIFQAREIERLAGERAAKSEMEPTLPPPVKAERPRPAVGSVVAALTVPRLGMSTIVVEGAEPPELRIGAGHIRGTSLPGQRGNVGVAGHRDTVFRPLRSIRKDDEINVLTDQREYQYRVVSTLIVEPSDVQVLYPTASETLTLVTCYPFNFVGSAPRRFIVRAECVNCSPAVSQRLSQ